MTVLVRIWLSILLAAVGAYGAYSGWRVYRARASEQDAIAVSGKSRPVERTRSVGSLESTHLVDSAGKPFDLAQLKGKVWLASFFFSACPGPCAQMNRAIAGLQNEFKDDDLKFVSITVDPDNDTPEVLQKYARTFLADPARWSFLSGPFAQVQKLGAEAFQVPVGPKMHTERVILVDRRGNVRSMYLTGDPAQMIALRQKIRDLLAEAAPPPGAAPAKNAAVPADAANSPPAPAAPTITFEEAPADPAETAGEQPSAAPETSNAEQKSAGKDPQ